MLNKQFIGLTNMQDSIFALLQVARKGCVQGRTL